MQKILLWVYGAEKKEHFYADKDFVEKPTVKNIFYKFLYKRKQISSQKNNAVPMKS